MFKLCLVVTLVGVAAASPTIKSLREIVGGQDIDISEAPHQVSLEFVGYFVCGGVIIAQNIIITAAHCVRRGSPDKYQVRAGSSLFQEGGDVYPVAKFIRHPDYDDSTLDNDIAVLWLSKPLQFSKNIATIDLIAKGEEVPDGAETVVTGFGRIREDVPKPSKLQMVKVPKLNDEACQKAYADLVPVTPNMICTSKEGKGPCRGDSGGPLVYQNKLVGVVSWGKICASETYPAVYAKVAALRPWLDSVIQQIEAYN